MSRMAMLWKMQHCWLARAWFSFDCYKKYAQLFLHRQGQPTFTLLSKEEVTKGETLSMVLCGINISSLVDKLWAEKLELPSFFYTDDTEIDGSDWQSAKMTRILL